MSRIDFERLNEIVLIFFDTKENYSSISTQSKIGNNFMEKYQCYNLEEFESIIEKYDPDQEFLTLVHLSSSHDNIGYYTFNGSGILKEYEKLNYYFISSVERTKITLQNSTIDVFSYDGYQLKVDNTFHPQTKLEMQNGKQKKLKKGIFLSHSSEDRKIIEKFRNLVLLQGLGININDIKFTSSEDAGINGGIDIPDDLEIFLRDKMGLFIQFITKDYKKSRVCLNEEGAAWVLLSDKYFIPVIVPPCNSGSISWIKTTNKGIRLNNIESLLKLYYGRKDFFDSTQFDDLKFNKSVKEFVEWFDKSKY